MRAVFALLGPHPNPLPEGEGEKRTIWRTDQFGELRDPSTGIYALLPSSVRTIGAQHAGFEQLHHTAFDRMERDPAEYKPDNLLTYLNSTNPVIDFSEPLV